MLCVVSVGSVENKKQEQNKKGCFLDIVFSSGWLFFLKYLYFSSTIPSIPPPHHPLSIRTGACPSSSASSSSSSSSIMASSNRHWPSMFKSKPCNPHHQWQHDINSSLMSTGCIRTPYNTSGGGCEERSPEPKPRWNPKPEQIRILEAIFNSGMVNPPRDEIRKIRAQLQEYGQVGDANVFYWFQNRKSRSKHKLRHLQNSKNNNNNQNINNPAHEQPPPPQQNPASLPLITALPSSSSSSSSEKSSPKLELIPNNTKVFALGFTDLVPNSPSTASVNQNYFQTHHHHNDSTSTLLLPPPPHTETFFFPVQLQHGQGGLPVVPNSTNNSTGVNVMTSQQSQGFCFSELSNVVHAQSSPHSHGHCTSGTLLLGEIMSQGGCSKKDQHQDQDEDKSLKTMHQQLPQLNFCVTPTTTVVVPPTTSTTITVPSPIIPHLHQGIADPGVAARSTVFINDVAFEVAAGPFNVREAFGEDAVLIHATGQPVLTNQWGVTLQCLQHGACYYLI